MYPLPMKKVFLSLLLTASIGLAAPANPDSLPGLFYDMGHNIGYSFWGHNFFTQAGAIEVTFLSQHYGVDYNVHAFFNRHPSYGTVGTPAATVGALAPVLLPVSLYAYGSHKDDAELKVAGFAVAQALGLAFTYHELLKAFTGRPAPQGVPESDMRTQSQTFRFGFMRGGLFWGWPSGHLITNTAAVSALAAYYPNSTAVTVAKWSWIS